tara:strand:+ start:502 stop:1407 length:906 start_codon:yes stop_codon:yes gene_type:complete
MTYINNQPQAGGVMDPGGGAIGGGAPAPDPGTYTPTGGQPGQWDFGAIPGLMQGGMNALGQVGGGGMNMLGNMAGSGMNMLGNIGGAASTAMGGISNMMGGLPGMMGGIPGMMGGIGNMAGMGLKGMAGMGGLGMKALGALGPMGLAAGGLLGGMMKQKTWNPADVIHGGMQHYGNKMAQSKNPFVRGLGKGVGNFGKLASNIVGSKGVAGKMWDSSIGALGKGLGKIFSDEKLKENVTYIGKSPMGVNVYEFDYKDKSYGSGRYRGVMAHEVPWAAERANNGYLRVDYSQVDVDFTTANR